MGVGLRDLVREKAASLVVLRCICLTLQRLGQIQVPPRGLVEGPWLDALRLVGERGQGRMLGAFAVVLGMVAMMVGERV